MVWEEDQSFETKVLVVDAAEVARQLRDLVARGQACGQAVIAPLVEHLEVEVDRLRKRTHEIQEQADKRYGALERETRPMRKAFQKAQEELQSFWGINDIPVYAASHQTSVLAAVLHRAKEEQRRLTYDVERYGKKYHEARLLLRAFWDLYAQNDSMRNASFEELAMHSFQLWLNVTDFLGYEPGAIPREDL